MYQCGESTLAGMVKTGTWGTEKCLNIVNLLPGCPYLTDSVTSMKCVPVKSTGIPASPPDLCLLQGLWAHSSGTEWLAGKGSPSSPSTSRAPGSLSPRCSKVPALFSVQGSPGCCFLRQGGWPEPRVQGAELGCHTVCHIPASAQPWQETQMPCRLCPMALTLTALTSTNSILNFQLVPYCRKGYISQTILF